MPRSRGRKSKLNQVKSQPRQNLQTVRPSRPYRFGQSLLHFLKSVWAIALIGGFVLATFVAAYSLWPRLSADVEKEPDFSSALPNAVSITNTGPVTLRDVAVSFGLCRATSDGGASVIGRRNPAKCNGSAIKAGNGIAHVLDWEGHTLVVDEKWTLSLPFKFASFGKEKLADGDVDYIVTFWAWPIPLYRHTVEFRFATQRQPNGNLIWAPIPVD
jgi:hypothetical protein